MSNEVKPDILPVERFNVITYVKNAYAELKKVSWPTREEAMQNTIVVIAFSVAFALFLGFTDLLLNEGFKLLLSTQGI